MEVLTLLPPEENPIQRGIKIETQQGRIRFGDMARTIADKWKPIDTNRRALLDHHAILEKERYRCEIQIWNAKKEQEAYASKSNS